MYIQNALSFAAEQLHASHTPAIDARWLLEYVLDKPHSYLLAHADDRLSGPCLMHYFELVARAEKGEPLPYIIGRTQFRYYAFSVTPDVLIPRPETELLVDKALRWANGRSGLQVVDIGTGSGCIAISLAKELNAPRVCAVDISAEALEIARQNAQSCAATIDFCMGSLLEPVVGSADLITANLPYITDDEWTALDDAVKLHEPALALRGGVDGLDLVRQLLQQAIHKLRPSGAIFLEIGWQQGAATVALAQTYFPKANVTCHQDYAGHDRIVSIVT